MYKFELKKAIKKNIFTYLLILSFAFPLLLFNLINYAEFFDIKNEAIRYSRNMIFDSINLTDLDKSNLSPEDMRKFNHEEMNLFMQFREKINLGRRISYTNTSETTSNEDSLKIRDDVIEYYNNQKELMKKYNIKFSKEQENAIEWLEFENQNMISNNTSLSDPNYWMYSNNPMRFFDSKFKQTFWNSSFFNFYYIIYSNTWKKKEKMGTPIST